MYTDALSLYNPLVEDVVYAYGTYRRGGKNREETVEQLREDFADDLGDYDCGPVVRIGLAMALCQKKELTVELRDDAIAAIDELIAGDVWGPEGNKVLERARKTLLQEKMLGDEAKYRPRRKYIPDWKEGDTFAHKMTDPLAEKLGMGGWYILFRKEREFVDKTESHWQLVNVYFCPPDRLPKTTEELDQLGCVKVNNGKVYHAYFIIKSKRGEDSLELEKIGCFPDAALPEDRIRDPYKGHILVDLKSRDGSSMYYEYDLLNRYDLYVNRLPKIDHAEAMKRINDVFAELFKAHDEQMKGK